MGFRLVRFVINTTTDFDNGAAQQLDADFFLVPDDRKVIHGTVRFPDGTPAPCTVVKFFKVLGAGDPDTTCNLESIGHAITDDCGQFLLGPLPPGVNVVIKIFFLEDAAVIGTGTPIIGTCSPLDP